MISSLKANPQMATASQGSSDEDIDVDFFRIGLVVKEDCYLGPLSGRAGIQNTAHFSKRAVKAMSSPLCSCRFSHVLLLDATEESDDEVLQRYHISQSGVQLLRGVEGFGALLQTNVEALYMFVPTALQRDYSNAALEARKHVLLNDPESTSLEDFRSQLSYAKKVQRFVNFPTMFVHQHRVISFLDCVSMEKFGSLESIDARLTVCFKDLHKVGVSLPLTQGQGCIQRLGRFCLLITTLIFTTRTDDSRPISAQVSKCEFSDSGQPVSADCVVQFTRDRVLTFHVAYSPAPTRQVLEVRSRDRYATLTDFVIPHPDGLSTYRIYDKALNDKTGKVEVESGEALDVPRGPSQDVMMWRRFQELCRSIEQYGWEERAETRIARDITSVALQTKSCLIALGKSLEEKCREVLISTEECSADFR